MVTGDIGLLVGPAATGLMVNLEWLPGLPEVSPTRLVDMVILCTDRIGLNIDLPINRSLFSCL